MGNQLRTGQFTLDCVEKYYKGYTFDQTWNGFACPYFSKQIAISLLEEMKKAKCISKYAYVEEGKDADCPYFKVTDCQGEVEIFEQENLMYQNKLIRVFGIGNFCWVWWDKKWN